MAACTGALLALLAAFEPRTVRRTAARRPGGPRLALEGLRTIGSYTRGRLECSEERQRDPGRGTHRRRQPQAAGTGCDMLQGSDDLTVLHGRDGPLPSGPRSADRAGKGGCPLLKV